MVRRFSFKLVYGILMLLYALCSNSCSKEKLEELNPEAIYFKEFPETKFLSFNNLFEYTEGNISNIMVCDTTLIFLNRDKSSKYFFFNYSLARNQLSNGYLRKGKGPNEAIGVFTSGITKDFLWTHDINKNTVSQISLSQALNANAPYQNNSNRLSDSYFHICMIDSITYWAVGDLSSSKKISIGNLSNSNIKEETGDFSHIPSKTPLQVFKDAHSCIILSKSDGTKVVVGYRYSDAIEIFNTRNKSYHTVRGPEIYPVEYDVGSSPANPFFMAKNTKTKKAFVNGAVTERFIYMLYSGCSRDEQNWNYAQKIYVYDWDGKPIVSYTLDRPVYTIAVNDDNSRIYSFDERTGFLIYAILE